jgi:hypothetical protein
MVVLRMHLMLPLQSFRLLLFFRPARKLLALTLLPKSLQPDSLNPTLLRPEPFCLSKLVPPG